MTREIKFRCWNKDKKEMHQIKRLDFGDAGITMDGFGDLFPLMQYTGLKDKNGKEIYEGDIVRVVGKIKVPQIIGFDTKEVRFCFVYDTGEAMRNMNPSEIPLLEIIGNIYENKDLIK